MKFVETFTDSAGTIVTNTEAEQPQTNTSPFRFRDDIVKLRCIPYADFSETEPVRFHEKPIPDHFMLTKPA